MADTPAKPTRKRWPWLVACAAALLAMLVWNWSETQLKQRAAMVFAGQSKEEVRSLLGEPRLTSFRGQVGTYRYGSERGLPWAFRAWARKYLRIGPPPVPNPFPVEVQFGDDGRVRYVRILE
ncbi:hypothetical protein AYO47_00010 [Planctomyces sp. SCGC AG-212-M04]|nr:hypothetical protein AYO47_00010 [Planctomyces sp. SCGC AG-212-M04]